MKSTTPKAIPDKAATVYDVARLAGLSRGTVTRVLSGSGYSSEESRSKVLEAVKQLGYQPNSNAQRLAQGHCEQTIALFTPTLDLGVAATTVDFIQCLLQQKGYSVPLHSLHWNARQDAETQLAILRELCRQKPRAIICNSNDLQPPAFEELARFQSQGGVVVCYGRIEVAFLCDNVIFDAEGNTYQAARHLLDQGHRSLAFCPHGGKSLKNSRRAGFCRALGEFGVPVREEWMLEGRGNYEECGARHAEQFLALRERPSGVCIVNDVSAATFLIELQRAGVRVPQDVSVVSHDDIPAARYALVPLTTVSQPCETIAGHVAEMILSRLDGHYNGAPRKVEVRGELIQRQSVAAMRAKPLEAYRTLESVAVGTSAGEIA